MAVLLPDGNYRLTRHDHPWSRDSHALPILGQQVPREVTGWLPGALVTRPGGSQLIRLDPAAWPSSTGDVIEKAGDTRKWTVTDTPELVAVPGHADVDHIRLPVIVMPPADPERGYPTSSGGDDGRI